MKETQDSWDAPPVEYTLIQKKLADITDKIVEVMKVNADLRSELDEVKTTTTQVQNDIADTRQTAVFIDQEVQNLSRNMTQGANVPNIRQDVITQLSEVTTDLQKELAELKDNYKVWTAKGKLRLFKLLVKPFQALRKSRISLRNMSQRATLSRLAASWTSLLSYR
jgi:septation ring formation regulator EzrA